MITFTTSYNSDLLIREACEGQYCEGAVLPLLVVCSNEKRLKYNLTVQQPFLITPQLGFFQKIAYRCVHFEIDEIGQDLARRIDSIKEAVIARAEGNISSEKHETDEQFPVQSHTTSQVRNSFSATQNSIHTPEATFDNITLQEAKLPKSSKEWMTMVKYAVGKVPQLTILLDLDQTLIDYPFNSKQFGVCLKNSIESELDISEWHFHYDPLALDQIAAAQDRGHRIGIVTSGHHPFEFIKELFAARDIALEESIFFNHDHKLYKDELSKDKFIDMLEFGNEALLIDDRDRYCQKVHSISPEHGMFPNISPDKCRLSSVEDW